MPTTRIIRRLALLAAVATATMTAGLAAATDPAGAAALRDCAPSAQDYYFGVQTVSANRQTGCRLATAFVFVYERDVALRGQPRPYVDFTLGQGPGAYEFALRFGADPGDPQALRIRARQLGGTRWLAFDVAQP